MHHPFADLLLDGATDANKQVFNILCEQPETVAAYLVPRVRTIVARGNGGQYVKYLTLPRALARFMTAPLRANRYFDRQGKLLSSSVYALAKVRSADLHQRPYATLLAAKYVVAEAWLAVNHNKHACTSLHRSCAAIRTPRNTSIRKEESISGCLGDVHRFSEAADTWIMPQATACTSARLSASLAAASAARNAWRPPRRAAAASWAWRTPCPWLRRC